MSKKLQETRSLINMSRMLGQEPAPELLEQLNRLEAEAVKKQQREAAIKDRIAQDLVEIFTPATVVEPKIETPAPEPIVETVQMPATVADQVAESIKRQLQTEEGTVVRPDPQMPNPNAALEQKVKYLENWISRIAATGPGGGAASTITLDYPVTTVTTSSYTISRRDHYIGINVAAACTVALPATGIKAGRNLIIKDESGHCSQYPITITGTIDNDTSGAILAVDNGGLHFIYNNGWRIV
jgi:hypothetical protein